MLTDAAARWGVLTALLAFARNADLALQLLPVIQVILASNAWSPIEMRDCQATP